jgi:hypothetical protein
MKPDNRPDDPVCRMCGNYASTHAYDMLRNDHVCQRLAPTDPYAADRALILSWMAEGVSIEEMHRRSGEILARRKTT